MGLVAADCWHVHGGITTIQLLLKYAMTQYHYLHDMSKIWALHSKVCVFNIGVGDSTQVTVQHRPYPTSA
jgi:hypothetical protein